MMRLGSLSAERSTSWARRIAIWCYCTDDQSRNRRLGLALGRVARSRTLSESSDSGRRRDRRSAVRLVAEREGVEMPICLEVYRIMHEASRADALQHYE